MLESPRCQRAQRMPLLRPRLLAVLLALAGAAPSAHALGFGPVPSGAILGQRLDFLIPLELSGGDLLGSECVSAEVAIGERRVQKAEVATRIEPVGGTVAVRITTSVVVDEPLLSVEIGLGCPVRLSRRFVVFADPPAAQAPSAPLVAAAADAAPPPATAPASTPAADPVPAPSPAAAPPASEPARGSASKPAVAPRQRPAVRRPAAEPQLAAPARVPGRPRLQLDAVDAAELRQARAVASDIAASAAATVSDAQALARSMAAAASAAEGRVAELERAMERMRAEAKADREALLALRQRAAQSDTSNLQLALMAAVFGLAALVLWLAYRLRRVQNEQQLAWLNAAHAAEVASAAADARTAAPDTMSVPQPRAEPVTTRPATLTPDFGHTVAAASAPDDAETAAERTQALPVGWREETEPHRDVSVEELIDLEQQAEFFTVLGQEEAAVDLLVDYLRSTGGGSPMPYLKLLEIYRRRGDRDAYDRTRARFNHRFNAYAPDWDSDPAKGRSLEDYPSIVARLQMAWASPIDAMAELESLLFRKSRGELFDLPAYRDVLFLYALARDLLDREPLETGNVDVLLPISDGSEFTRPQPLGDFAEPSESTLASLDNPPTVPIDLDVTQPSMPESLFGENATLPGGQTRRRL